MGVYRRGSKLWLRWKGPDGKWHDRSSGYAVGEESLAMEMYAELQRRIRDALNSKPARQPEPDTLLESLVERVAQRAATVVLNEIDRRAKQTKVIHNGNANRRAQRPHVRVSASVRRMVEQEFVRRRR